MDFLKSSTFKKYFVPGFIFQGVVIAGGYGTGRELVEFFLEFGPTGGLIAMICTALVTWSIVSALSYEFARMYKAYNYGAFFKKLLGKFWFLYEITFIYSVVIVTAIVAASAGSILNEVFNVNYFWGVSVLLLAVAYLTLKGNEAIEKFFSYWSILLYVVYIIFLVTCFVKFGNNISANLSFGEVKSGFIFSGFKYAWYNLGVIPVILFATRHIETRKEAIGSGLIAGMIGIFPGILLLIALTSQYPNVLEATVPSNFVLEMIGSRPLQITFQLILFGTMIQTGTGMVFSLTERVGSFYADKGKEMTQTTKRVLTIITLCIGVIVAQFGLVGLIAKGYGTMTWLIFFSYVIPLFTVGVWKIINYNKSMNNISK